MTKLQSHRVIILLSLFFITILSRIPFRSKVLCTWDSVEYALATEHYDITVHQPHPPGYFLYVMLGKLLNMFTYDANTSFVILSIFFSGLTVVMVYMLASRMFNERIALVASLLTMTSPTVWFQGEVAMNYIIEAFFSTCFAFCCWKAVSEKRKWILVASLSLAIAGGVRQTMLIFLFPLWIFSLVKVPAKYRIYAFAILLVGVLFWFIPMISLTGGYLFYKKAFLELLRYGPSFSARSITENSFALLKTVLQFTLIGLGLSTVFLLFYLRSCNGRSLLKVLSSTKCLFFMFWVLPPLLFYILVFIDPAIIGFSLIYLPAFLILSAHALDKITLDGVNVEVAHWILTASLIVAMLFNGSIFLFSNKAFSYGFLKRQHQYITSLVNEVRKKFSPEDTVIMGGQYIFFGPRHFMYYLPEYIVYVMDEGVNISDNESSRRVFWGRNHCTYLSDAVHIPPSVKSFISPEESSKDIKGVSNLQKELLVAVDQNISNNVFFYDDVKLAPIMYPKINFVFHDK